ncbi:MAG: hypothetical protein AAF468_21015 [Pseudomonadota bacterium]
MTETRAPFADVRLFEDALPHEQFELLKDAIQEIGNERLENNGTYATTFWFPRGERPTNLAEEAIVRLFSFARPPQSCIGAEWWLGRLKYGKRLKFHFDRDLVLSREAGRSVLPLLGSVFYLNAYPSSPTVLLDQVPGPDGKSKVPPQPKMSTSIAAIPNHYTVFPGNLLHGVVPDSNVMEQEPASEELRLTLLVNFWDVRPSPPVCRDYDGSIYRPLMEKFAA